MTAGRSVLVLGAGASVAEAMRFRPRQERDHPPLDGNFFVRAAKHVDPPVLEPILRRAEDLGQPDLLSSAQRVSLERYLGRLYFEMNNTPSDANLRAYFDLVRLYAAELLTTTNWLVGRRGSIYRLIRSELDVGRTVTLITFNHDLLIENALAQLSSRRYGQAWCLRHAYRYGPVSMSDTCSIPGDPSYDLDCPGSLSDHIPVYKMHGSLNWVFRTLRAYPSADFARQDRKLIVWNNTRLPPWASRLGTARGHRDWYLWPLVVPPVYEKHGFIHGRLRRVWDGAWDALAQADRVIFWGYSFPSADLHARYFFQGAAQKNASLRMPVLINPDPAAHAALWEVLRPRHVHHFHDVVDFLEAQ